MKKLKILGLSFLICVWTSTLYADVYFWTDENGTTHFSNHSPPPEAEVFVREIPKPYDFTEEDEEPGIENEKRAGNQDLIRENLEEKLLRKPRGVWPLS